ncbi:N-acetylglucosamine kinase [Pseudonocardia acaciae]|uniref:N-acetylglucosamine kinase n=1 Tax=Pseudonocardia acaciae TaxID=551276 RepID=UPI0006850817|nr:BadF/BadG/BcrA/BcrD ATPase family protein [Pseudonocardia acaciae]
MTRVLALDVGKTGSRAALFVDGVRTEEATGTGALGLAEADGVARAMAAITGVTEGWGGVDAVTAGLAGLGRGRDKAPALAAALTERFGTEKILLTGDMAIAHAGALGGEPGAVLAAGTGAIAMSITPDGRSHTVDGWGYLLGDNGSAYAIGKAGLEAALRAHDGRRGGSTRLRRLATARYGQLEGMPTLVFAAESPPQLMGGFARDVAEAARAGDEVAGRIWADAARALAETAAAALAALAGSPGGSATLACTGGLFDVGTLLTDPFDRELAALAPGVPRSEVRGDALEGAYLLHARPDLPHPRLFDAGTSS